MIMWYLHPVNLEPKTPPMHLCNIPIPEHHAFSRNKIKKVQNERKGGSVGISQHSKTARPPSSSAST
jgi:hypothetical protein